MVHMWQIEDNFGYWSYPSILFETVSLLAAIYAGKLACKFPDVSCLSLLSRHRSAEITGAHYLAQL